MARLRAQKPVASQPSRARGKKPRQDRSSSVRSNRQEPRFTRKSGAPGGIRTPNPLLRRQTLYPTELRARCRQTHSKAFSREIEGTNLVATLCAGASTPGRASFGRPPFSALFDPKSALRQVNLYRFQRAKG